MIKYQQRFNRSHSSAEQNAGQERVCEKGERTADATSTPLLKSWRSWPGFLLVACEGLSGLYREITNGFFNISCLPKHRVCWNPAGGNTLSLGGPGSHTKGPAKSHQVHETTTALHTQINNICPFFSAAGVGRGGEKKRPNNRKLPLCCGTESTAMTQTLIPRWLHETSEPGETKAIRRQRRLPQKAYFASSEMFWFVSGGRVKNWPSYAGPLRGASVPRESHTIPKPRLEK